jgi:hypothetical protein
VVGFCGTARLAASQLISGLASQLALLSCKFKGFLQPSILDILHGSDGSGQTFTDAFTDDPTVLRVSMGSFTGMEYSLFFCVI